MKSLILSHIHLLHEQMPCLSEIYVQLVKGACQGSGHHVVVAKALKPRTVWMVP